MGRKQLGIAVFALVAACGGLADDELDPVDDPLEWVDPRIGSGGFGFAYGSAFVGAAAPHGLVKLGPDTRGEYADINFLHYSGYWAEDDTIEARVERAELDHTLLQSTSVLRFEVAEQPTAWSE